jgi:hypothetical protein
MQWLKTRGQRDRHVIALMDGRSKRSAFDDRHRRSVEGRLALQSFVINSHGRMVFPSNFIPDLDFTVIDSLDQLEEVVRRDVEAKAPSGTEILRRIEAGDHYRTLAAQEGCGAHASKTAGRRARLPIGTTRTGSSTAPG